MTLHTYLHVLTVRDRQFVSESIPPPGIEYPRLLALAGAVIQLEADARNRIIRRNSISIDARDGDETVVADMIETHLSKLGEDDLLTGFDIGRSLDAVARVARHGMTTPIPAITRVQLAYAGRDVRITCLGDTPPPVASLFQLATNLQQPLSFDLIVADDWPVIRALAGSYAGLAMCHCSLRHQPQTSR